MMIALSIRQPWAWLILHAGKDIENRTWYASVRFRGPILIHAAKGMTRGEYDDAMAFARGIVGSGVMLPPFEQLPRGGIVGEVNLVEVVTSSRSPWFFGPYGFVLSDPRPLPFEPCRGQLGFFEP